MSFCRLFSAAIVLVASATASPSIRGRDGAPSRIPPVSVPAKLQTNTEGGLKDLLQRDLARVRAFQARHASVEPTGMNFAQEQDIDVPLTNGGTSFMAEVEVGIPATKYNLLVDTGSSNTILGPRVKYQPTLLSKNTTRHFKIEYGSGDIEGFQFTDNLAIGGESIIAQSIGVGVTAKGFDDLDGLLGLGPTALTRNTVDGADTVPTVTDNLAEQGLIDAAIVGFSVPPSTDPMTEGASLEFGAPDGNKFTGDLNYVPITKRSPSSRYWGIDQSISYGKDKTQILKAAAGIVDTGTTLVLLATDAFNVYVKATGAKNDTATGLLKLDNKDNLQSLFFYVGNAVYEFTANAQIWPRILNTAIGGDRDATYLVVGDLGKPSGNGMDFVSGLTFLQRFYSVYDTTNKRVGLATTNFTTATSN